MHALRDFFIFCSGSYATMLNKTPSEINKFVGIGATIFFTGIFAAIAGGFALHTIFGSYPIAIVFGILWGLMIFNLDRFIVMSIKKRDRLAPELITATPRLLLAVLIAFVISKPLELKLFQSEIAGELVLMEQELGLKHEVALKDRFKPEIAELEIAIIGLNTQIESKRIKRDELNQLAIQEADGTGGSKEKNLGPIYKTKKAEADKAELTLAQTKSEIDPLIEIKRSQISSLETQMQDQLSTLSASKLNGFAAQLDALGRLAHKSSTIWYASLFITLLFIAIETAPIVTKLISYRSPYDFKLDEHEFKFQMHHQLNNTRLKTQVENQLAFEKETKVFIKSETVKAEIEVIQALVQEELHKLKDQPITWAQYRKLKNVFGNA